MNLGDYAKLEASYLAIKGLYGDAKAEITRLQHQREILAQAIGAAVMEAGIANEGPMTGAELLLLLEDLVKDHTRLQRENEKLRAALIDTGCSDFYCEESARKCDNCPASFRARNKREREAKG